MKGCSIYSFVFLLVMMSFVNGLPLPFVTISNIFAFLLLVKIRYLCIFMIRSSKKI